MALNKLLQLSIPSSSLIGAAVVAMLIALPDSGQAQEANDYSNGNNWLCRGTDSDLGACDTDLNTTIVHANGRLALEEYHSFPDAPIDCFYVYPTVSLDSTPNSDMNAGPEEFSVVASQFARFGSRCRTFAPLYRQFTLGALRSGASGADRQLGYNDVLASWQYYLENYNDGRGVVLVGHSQGSGVLTSLIRNEIDGKPIQQQIISAMLLGTTVQVPAGEVVGGTFQQMPLCASANQNQCIIVYATFRDTVPPSPNSLFGRNGDGTVAACTNPAQLANGNNEAHAYLSGAPGGRTTTPRWTKDLELATTPFVSVPGLLTVECVHTASHAYLQLNIHGDTADSRTDNIAGDILTAEGVADSGWGLHLLDANVGMGDLLTLLDQQAVAYLGK